MQFDEYDTARMESRKCANSLLKAASTVPLWANAVLNERNFRVVVLGNISTPNHFLQNPSTKWYRLV